MRSSWPSISASQKNRKSKYNKDIVCIGNDYEVQSLSILSSSSSSPDTSKGEAMIALTTVRTKGEETIPSTTASTKTEIIKNINNNNGINIGKRGGSPSPTTIYSKQQQQHPQKNGNN